MRLLIDTGSWLKLARLQKVGLFKVEILYQWAEIQITHDVQKELDYWSCSIWKKEKTQIIPVKNERIFNEAKIMGYDEADASIFSNGSKDPDFLILSEDRALIKFSQLYEYPSVQLIDLFGIFMRLNIITRNDLYRLNKFLRNLRNITKKKQKAIKYRLLQNHTEE